MIEAMDECSNCGEETYNCDICNKKCCGYCGEVTGMACLVCKKTVCQEHLALCWCQCTDGVCIQCIDAYSIKCTLCNISYPVSHFYDQKYGYICYDANDHNLCDSCIPIYNSKSQFKYWKDIAVQYVCLKFPTYYPTERIKDRTEGGLHVIEIDRWKSVQKVLNSDYWDSDQRDWIDDIEVYENPSADVISFVQKIGNKDSYDLLCEWIHSFFERNSMSEEFLDRNLLNIYNEIAIPEMQMTWNEWIESYHDTSVSCEYNSPALDPNRNYPSESMSFETSNISDDEHWDIDC